MSALGIFCCRSGQRCQRWWLFWMWFRLCVTARSEGSVGSGTLAWRKKRLRNARDGHRGWPRHQLSEPSHVLSDGAEQELVLCATRATEPKATEPKDALQMSEQHLDALAIAARLLERFGARERTGGVAGVLVDAAGDFALGRFWAAFGFQRTRATVVGPCAIEDRLPAVDRACRVQQLALWAHINIADPCRMRSRLGSTSRHRASTCR